MKKFYKVLQKIAIVLCGIIIAWFLVYFLRGEEFSLTFSDRVFASYFPQILVFSTGAAIYLLFIFRIKSSLKWWKNLLILILGFIFATIPFLLYHGYFQYQCSFWNNEIKFTKDLYQNKNNIFETIKIVETKCPVNEETTIDTVFVKEITDYFLLIDEVKISQSEKGSWSAKK